jgi:2,5-dihydroxypyridine 5,6-dioxygenase
MKHAALVDAFTEVFELSELKPEEKAVILTDGPLDWPYVEIAQQAFSRLGVASFRIDLSATAYSGDEVPAPGAIGDLLTQHPAALEALRSCDFVIDFLTTELAGLIHDRSRATIAEAGTRMLHVNDPPEQLLRCRPSVALRDRCLEARDRLRATKEFRVTSAAGTDFTVDLEGAVANALYGYVENPGQAGSWPGGFVAAYPVTGSGAGQVVLEPGDLELTTMRFVESRVTLVFEADHVVDIRGDGVDAAMLRDYMAMWNEPEAYGLSHVGWGLNHDANWWTLGTMHPVRGDFAEGRAFPGSFMVSTGVNLPAGRMTRCHFDLPMRGCSVFLDGEAVVEEGRLVEPAGARG